MMRTVQGVTVGCVFLVWATVVAGKVIESPVSPNGTASAALQPSEAAPVDVSTEVVDEAEVQNPGTKYQELELPKTDSQTEQNSATGNPHPDSPKLPQNQQQTLNKEPQDAQKNQQSIQTTNQEISPQTESPSQQPDPHHQNQTIQQLPLKLSNSSSQPQKITYRGVKLVRVRLRNKEQRKLIRQLEEEGDVDTWMGNGTVVDILVRNNGLFDFLKSKNFTYDVVLDDLQRAIDEENPPLDDDEWSELEGRKVENDSHWWPGDGFFSSFHIRIFNHVSHIKELIHFHDHPTNELRKKRIRRKKTKKKKKPQRGHRMTWQMYHRMSDINGYLDYLTTTYPEICSQEIIGYSVERKPLKVLKISSGKPNSKAIWVDSGIHAREWIAPATSTYAISQMVENGDGTHGVDWYFLPLVNPDGYEHSHTFDRLWRKNRSNAYRGPCAGTDLNRNFGYRWGGIGSSQQPCSETYAGPRAFSESETDAIKEFIMTKTKDMKAYISLHSYGQYILYPWGYDRKVPPDYSDLHRVGRAMAQAIKNSSGQNYKVGSAAAVLYRAAGGSDDWAKGTAKIKYVYTIELRDTGRHGFVLPAQYILPTAQEAYAALKVLANEVIQL